MIEESGEKKDSDAGREKAQADLILAGALNHPLRRQILRSLIEHGSPLSSSRLRREWVVGSVSEVAYHMKTLRNRGAIHAAGGRQVRGATETFYGSKVDDYALVLHLLDQSEDDDARYRRHS